MKKAFEQKNTLLIILLAVSSLIALLLFLDTVIPVFPTSLARPDTEEGEAGTGDGSETKKHWWEGIFGRDEPTETDGLTETDEPADEPAAEAPPIYPDTDSPSVGWEDLLVYPSYTEKALIDDYGTPLVRALERLADMEVAGTIQPIDRVGFFDLNGNGVPEVITMGIYNGYVEYIAYDVYSWNALSWWGWEGTQYGELSLWMCFSPQSSVVFASVYRSLITHPGDGDDEYICEITDTWLDYRELFAQVSQKPSASSSVMLVSFRLDGEKTDMEAYTAAYEQFNQTNQILARTTMVTVPWNASDPEGMAERILTAGQQFFCLSKG